MYKIDKIRQEIQMIEDGYLIDKETILRELHISKDDLEDAIFNSDIDVVLSKYGTEYYLREQVELYVRNKNS